MVSRDASRVKDQTVRGTFKLQAHGLKMVPGICLIPVKNYKSGALAALEKLKALATLSPHFPA